MSRVDGTALVTGASGGIGHAIARALADRGASLILTGRRAEVLESLAAELGARALAADLADPVDVARLAAEAAEVDVLVANAALPADGPIDDYTIEQIDRALAVNLRAPIVLAKALSESMRARGGGHLVFISSIAGKVVTEGSSLYSATKFGLRGFAAGLREDLRGTGVGVSTVFPGFIREAGMFAEAGVKLPPGVGTRTPQDVGRAVVAAIERDRAEVDVASVAVRIGGAVAGFAPGVVAAVNRQASSPIARGLAAAHRDKR